MLQISNVPLFDSRLYFAAEKFPSIEVAICLVRGISRPQRPSNSANDKPKFTSLQTTFSRAQNCDLEESIIRSCQGHYYLLSCRSGNSPRISRLQSYNPVMARGWESKAVEEQQSAANTQVESKQRLTPQQAARKQEHDALELSRKSVLQQLQSVENPRRRQMLEIALAELDQRLARLG
jgi:hypothetical protein